ncbi:hypothetical protein L1987_08614 [Smallanthus sonchifolius]|uniref:Uncharacterized protein n=1 Tax=Smallanthus sonchifolius TaxID=185202 RepID=A0ACB9JN34_9ASTR|nr:hypothetical protein L1987_08614 [Smallanthus sonchifolius]
MSLCSSRIYPPSSPRHTLFLPFLLPQNLLSRFSSITAVPTAPILDLAFVAHFFLDQRRGKKGELWQRNHRNWLASQSPPASPYRRHLFLQPSTPRYPSITINTNSDFSSNQEAFGVPIAAENMGEL